MKSIFAWAAGALILGVASGLAWLWLASPAEWEVTSDGIILTEEGAKGRFGVIVTFVLIGIAVSVVAGSVTGFRLRHVGWLLVPVVALTSLLVGVIAWRIGAVFGPPDPASVTGASVGDRLPQQLAIDAFAPFLIWPIFALVGLFLAVYSTGDKSAESARHRDEVVGS